MREKIEASLSSTRGWTKASRALLEVLRDFGGADSLSREEARRELERREGKPIKDAAFGQRLKRLNDELARATPALRVISERGELTLNDGGPELESRLEERSRQETLREGVGRERPRAMPESLLVLFSYGWQPIPAQHQAQVDLYERLRHILREAPPPEFAWLPRIEIWRDVDRLEHSHGAEAQIEDACDKAFLLLAMMSRKYPGSPGCMMEFDKFVAADGANLPGKFAIAVAVNCKPGDVEERFSRGLRLWIDDEGRTLLQVAQRRAYAKDQFARKVARQIRLAAVRYLGGSPTGPSGGNGAKVARARDADAADEVADYMLRRASGIQLGKTLRPRARQGAAGPDVTSGEASAVDDGDGADIVKRLVNWAERRDGPRMMALLGDFGMGKTVTCQMLTQELLQRRRCGILRAPLPIYLDLREISDPKTASSVSLEALITQMLRRVGETPLDPAEVIRYARENGALVIFDGLDEVTNKLSNSEAEALYRTILRIVRDDDWRSDRDARLAGARTRDEIAPKRGRPRAAAARKGPLLLISCRTHYFPDIATQRAFLVDKDRAGLDPGADVEIWFMLPFNKSQVEGYLRQNLGEAHGARALEMIGATYNLEEVVARPILLKFFASTFQELERQKLAGATIDIGRLYEAFVDQTLARDGLKHVIPRREKKLLLAELAFHLHVEGLSEIANDDLDAWLAREIDAEPALRKLQWAAPGENALSRFELFMQDLRNATLLVRPGEKHFRFGHTSVREFFLAEALHRRIGEGRLTTLGGRVFKGRETIDFLLARQKNGVEPAAARAFRENLPRLSREGVVKDLRVLATQIHWWADGALPWPERADLSEIDLSGLTFSGPGSAEKGLRRLPPKAIWRGARLHKTIFFDSALYGHDFSGVDASTSAWVNCDFSGAKLDRADFRAASFRECRSAESWPGSARMELATGVRCAGALASMNARSRLDRFGAPLPARATFAGAVAAFEWDGRAALASGSHDNTLRLWDATSGARLRVFEGHGDIVTSVAALTLDGRAALASGSYDKTLRLWDATSGACLRVFEGHGDMVTSVAALTLDGRAALASGSYDNTLRLWDATSGVQLATTGGSFANLAISPTETEGRLLTGGSGGCVFVGFDVDAVHGDTRVKGAKFHSIILDHEIAGILLDYQSDFATGQSRATAIGPNAWRGFIAVGHDAAGCQSLRPIEDMLLG